MAHTTHGWKFGSITVHAPRQTAPGITVLWWCRCGATRTERLKNRVPSSTALTDEERFDRVAMKQERALYRATWGDKATDAMAAAGIRPVVKQEGG